MLIIVCLLILSGLLSCSYKSVVYSLVPVCLCPFGILFYHAFLVVDRNFFRHTGIHLQWQWIWYLKEKMALKGSISKRMIFSTIAFIALVLSIDAFLLWDLSPLPYGWLCAPALLLLWDQRHCFKKKKSIYKIEAQNENYHKLDPNFPLLKHTTGFSNSQLFECNVGDQPHIIFISMESFASSQLGAAPFFNELKNQGVYFDQFYSVSTRSTPALIASHYGVPTHPQKMYDRQLVAGDLIGLPQMLKKRGYQTAFAHNGDISFEDNKALLLNNGFDLVWGYQKIVHAYPEALQQGWGIDDEYLYAFSSKWLHSHEKPCFLSLMTLTNHHPWHLPKRYSGPEFEDAPSDAHRRFWKTMNYSDAALGAFLCDLKESGLDRRCIFFIYGDHGQALGEHQQSLAGRADIFEESVHVPLLIYAPGRVTPNVISTPSSQVDIPPTVMDLFSLQSSNCFVGSSLRRPIGNRPVFFSAPFKEGQQGMRLNHEKVVYDRRLRKTFAYDLSKDANEKNPQELSFCETLEAYHDLIAQLHDQKSICPKLGSKTTSGLGELIMIRDPTFCDQALSAYTHFMHSLKLQGTCVTNAGLKRFICNQPYLHTLVIADMQQISSKAFLLDSPHLCLRALYLQSFQFFDQNLKIIQKAFPNLNQLYLSMQNLSPSAMLVFLSSLTNLEILTLEGCYDLSDDDMDQLLNQQKQLKRLHIHKGNKLTDRACYAIAKADLEVLHLDGALITNSGLKALSEADLHTIKTTNCLLLNPH